MPTWWWTATGSPRGHRPATGGEPRRPGDRPGRPHRHARHGQLPLPRHLSQPRFRTGTLRPRGADGAPGRPGRQQPRPPDRVRIHQRRLRRRPVRHRRLDEGGHRPGLIPGPRLVPCSRDVSTTGHAGDRSFPPHWEVGALGAIRPSDGPDEFRKSVRAEIKEGAEIIKMFVTGGHGTIGPKEHDRDDPRRDGRRHRGRPPAGGEGPWPHRQP